MSLVSKFIMEHLVSELEKEFISHVPDMQKKLVEEVEVFVQMLSVWISNKLGHAPTDK